MTTPKQPKNPQAETATIVDGIIMLKAVGLTQEQAKQHVKLVSKLIKDCNVATLESPPLVRSLFASCDDPKVFTLYIRTDQEFHDIRSALKPQKDTIISLLARIMEYYSEKESINIILSREVMRNRGDTYHRYTAQFAQQVASHTQEFLKIKAIYSAERGELGIFCRKSEFDISTTFFGQLLNQLRSKGHVYVDFNDMPDTYVAYPSMLHFKLKQKLRNPKIKMTKLAKGLKFSGENTELVVDALS